MAAPRGPRTLARPTRTQVPLGAGCGVAFATPFLAAGIGITWFAVHQQLAGADAQEGGPWPILAGIGIVFGAAGLFVAWHSVAGAIRKWRVERRMLAAPHEPWRADFDWDERYAHDTHTAWSWLGALVFLVLLCLFLAPFNWWALQEGFGIVMIFTLLFDLLPVLLVVGFAMGIVHRWKYGRPRLALDRFPFFLGEELAVRLVAPRPLRRCHAVVVVLRQVDEAVASDGEGTTRVEAREGYRAQVRHERVRDLLEDGALPIRFPLPPDGQETWLGHTPPRYWEIEVKGEAPGLDFEKKFLVPVYRRRHAAA